MESCAFPEKIRMKLKIEKIWTFLKIDGRSIFCQIASNRKTFSQKEPFGHQTLDHSQVTQESQIEPRYTLFSGQGIQLSGKVPFVIFEWLVWELPADNQRVSDSIFKVKQIIYIVRWDSQAVQGFLIFYGCTENQ